MRLLQDLTRSGLQQHHLDVGIESMLPLQLEPALHDRRTIALLVPVDRLPAGVSPSIRTGHRHFDTPAGGNHADGSMIDRPVNALR